MAKRSNRRLVSFLRKYSAGKARDLASLYKQWALIEVRDAGRRRDLICPCGQSGLRYLCFIRNRITDVQTYVGVYCVRRFTNKYVPRLLMLMETLSRSGITGRYLGPGGRGRHRFTVRTKTMLVRRIKLLQHFFSQVPLEKTTDGWEVTVLIRHNQFTFRTPGLKRFKWYNIKLGPVTGGGQQKARPALYFYADRIRQAY